MELNIHLQRCMGEAWGFRLSGGTDFGMPLTVMKILQDSPADKAGLKDCDVVLRINDTNVQDISHEESKRIVGVAAESLVLSVMRGFYDPVLDDFEPTYEQIDLEDFDQPSATEVSCTGYSDTEAILSNRSLTVSPFIITTKPYSPFSTEPAPEIPPLEDPIILNPNYCDDFTKYIICEDCLPKTKFKLPISEQYDPDGSRPKNVQEIKSYEDKIKNEKTIRKESKFVEELDMENIEMIASSVVEGTITNAISISEEIKKEIHKELQGLSLVDSNRNLEANMKESLKEVNLESKSGFENSEQIIFKGTNDIADLHTRSREIISESSSQDETHVSYDRNKSHQANEKTVIGINSFSKQEIQESASEKEVNGSTEMYDNKRSNTSQKDYLREAKLKSKDELCEKNIKIETKSRQLINETHNHCESKQNTNCKQTNINSNSQHRNYVLGLQSIPNIKGTIHSTYHYNLLLKTFFVHLTDVMVALSGFILSEIPFDGSKDCEKENKKSNFERKENINQETLHKQKNIVEHDTKEHIKTTSKVDLEVVNAKKNYVAEEEHRRKLLGSKVIQMSEQESSELIESMGAVISEFQSKVGIENETSLITTNENFEASSEKNIEENIAKEAFEKDLKNAERFSLSSHTKNPNEKDSKAEEYYVAVVESHVYTNKNLCERSSDGTGELNFLAEDIKSTNTEEIFQRQKNNKEFTVSKSLEKSDEMSLQNTTVLDSNKKQNFTIQTSEQFQNLIKEEIQENSSTAINFEENDVKQEESNSSLLNADQFEQLVSLPTISDDKKGKSMVEENNLIRVTSSKSNCERLDHKSKSFNVENSGIVKGQFEDAINQLGAFDNLNNCSIQETSETHLKVYQDSVVSNMKSIEVIQDSFATSRKTDAVHEFSQKQSHTQSLHLDLNQSKSYEYVKAEGNDQINIPTATTIPPTPLTDEYVFRLEIPYPHCVNPLPSDPDTFVPTFDEDPHIVKKNLVPEIDSPTIESVLYDPPLPTPPPGEKLSSPVYTKPGLKGGADHRFTNKEEIFDLQRTSSLLASAIDETIKSIEEYKETTVVKNHSDNSEDIHEEDNSWTGERPIMYNGFATVESKVYDTSTTMNENYDAIASKIIKSYADINSLTSRVTPIDNDHIDVEESAPEHEEELEVSLQGFRSVKFKAETANKSEDGLHSADEHKKETEHSMNRKVYVTETGDILGSKQGIIDGLEEAVIDDEVAREMGKPGMTEEKIAELMSGESEMLKEAHIMGLKRVITSHMTRTNEDDSSSVDLQKIKPIIVSLKDSEVLKALNEELTRTKVEKKKEDNMSKWTTFLQKPQRPVPKAKFGYCQYSIEDEEEQEPYKVRIVKQPKPRVAPDYKPEDFDTGPLPWEERAQKEPLPSSAEPEEPILVPEELPEFLEAVDPLPESEVPDLEETEIIITSEQTEEPTNSDESEVVRTEEKEEKLEEEADELDLEAVVEETERIVIEMEQNKLAEQVINSVQSMVDPNASLEQQLAQMRAQLAALAQLPGVIQQSLELVTKQLGQIGVQESIQSIRETQNAAVEEIHNTTMEEIHEEIKVQEITSDSIQEQAMEVKEQVAEKNEETNEVIAEENKVENNTQEMKKSLTTEEFERMKREEKEILAEQRKIEMQKKDLIEQLQQEQRSRQIKQQCTPRPGRPKPVFGPITPQERPVVLPGGRRWRKPEDAYNEQFIAETLSAQAEIIRGKAKGLPYESVILPYDERINFLKYEKPPVSLDHLQHSDVYKLIHDMEKTPTRQIEMRTPVMAECDYREKCRSMTPCAE